MAITPFYTQVYSGADVTPSLGTLFTITSPSWYTAQETGDILEILLRMSFEDGLEPKFTKITLNEQDMCGGAAPPETTEKIEGEHLNGSD